MVMEEIKKFLEDFDAFKNLENLDKLELRRLYYNILDKIGEDEIYGKDEIKLYIDNNYPTTNKLFKYLDVEESGIIEYLKYYCRCDKDEIIEEFNIEIDDLCSDADDIISELSNYSTLSKSNIDELKYIISNYYDYPIELYNNIIDKMKYDMFIEKYKNIPLDELETFLKKYK